MSGQSRNTESHGAAGLAPTAVSERSTGTPTSAPPPGCMPAPGLLGALSKLSISTANRSAICFSAFLAHGTTLSRCRGPCSCCIPLSGCWGAGGLLPGAPPSLGPGAGPACGASAAGDAQHRQVGTPGEQDPASPSPPAADAKCHSSWDFAPGPWTGPESLLQRVELPAEAGTASAQAPEPP